MEAWSFLGIQKKTKDSKVKQDVFENIAYAIKTIGKSKKKDTSAALRIIQRMIISSSTRQKRLTTRIQDLLELHRKYCKNIKNFNYK